jgi:ferredoxin
MPYLLDRLTQNASGRYYVDSTCVDCDLCRSTAPDFFTRDDESGFSFVYRQPTTAAQIALAEEAIESCPSESIGRDGAPATLASPPHTTPAAAITAAAMANISSVTAVERT